MESGNDTGDLVGLALSLGVGYERWGNKKGEKKDKKKWIVETD